MYGGGDLAPCPGAANRAVRARARAGGGPLAPRAGRRGRRGGAPAIDRQTALSLIEYLIKQLCDLNRTALRRCRCGGAAWDALDPAARPLSSIAEASRRTGTLPSSAPVPARRGPRHGSRGAGPVTLDGPSTRNAVAWARGRRPSLRPWAGTLGPGEARSAVPGGGRHQHASPPWRRTGVRAIAPADSGGRGCVRRR